jgi:Leucine rich repeat/Leucine Rich repeat
MAVGRSHIYLKILKTTLLVVLCTSSHLLGAVELHAGRGVSANRRYEHAPHRRGLDATPEFRAKRATDERTSGVVFVVSNRSKNNLTIDLHRCNVDDSNFCKTLNDSLSDQSVSVVSVVNLSQNYLQQLNYNYLNKFVNLQQLDLSSNNLSAIVSLASDRLEYLNVSGNQILRFSGEKLRNLKFLDLSSNQLNESRYIVLYDLLHLTSIDLSCNHLSAVDKNLFLNNRNLRHIDLSGNLLTRITRDTFNNLDNLEVLDLTNNNISWIENDTFSCLPSLQYLDLAGNDIHIASIRALQGIPDLIGLSLAFNRHLNDVNDALQGFVASWSLRELDISGTDLCDVPAALTQSVRMLNLADNYLQVSYSYS